VAALWERVEGGRSLCQRSGAATARDGDANDFPDGQARVQDGPYADTKEQLGGFCVIDVPDLDAALEWAARCPRAPGRIVEVRPNVLAIS